MEDDRPEEMNPRLHLQQLPQLRIQHLSLCDSLTMQSTVRQLLNLASPTAVAKVSPDRWAIPLCIHVATSVWGDLHSNSNQCVLPGLDSKATSWQPVTYSTHSVPCPCFSLLLCRQLKVRVVEKTLWPPGTGNKMAGGSSHRMLPHSHLHF